MDSYLESKLCSADLRLKRMVESVTKREIDFKRGDGGYFFTAGYSQIDTPEQILALWDAIEGYLGDRLEKIQDCPDGKSIYVKVKYATE